MPATYEPIASTSLGSDTASHTFSSIPGTFTDLVLVVHGRTSQSGNLEGAIIRFNSDTGANYSMTTLEGNGTSASSGRSSDVPDLNLALFAGSSQSANNFSVSVLHVMSYANTSVFKTVLSAQADAATLVRRQVGLWRSTSAVTSIYIAPGLGNLKSGSTFSLYGIKAA